MFISSGSKHQICLKPKILACLICNYVVQTFRCVAQNRLAGPDKGISDSCISLEIESPNVPDLTLVDLPGITRLAVEGQGTDVSEQVLKLHLQSHS